MLAILKAGGAYVPIDTMYPADRISFILQDCKPAVILTTLAESKHLPGTTVPLLFLDELQETIAQPEDNPCSPDIYSDDPAYIIYTSGTTGTPKGVIVPHRGVIRLVFGQDFIGFGPEKIFLQLASLAFDAATFEIWGPLLHGGTCVLYPGNRVPDPITLQQLVAKENISTVWLTATLFNTLITVSPECLKEISVILTGGEALSPLHIRKALKTLTDTKLINGYGPTENTTFTTCYEIPRDLPPDCTSIPIGKPLKHTTIYILDRELNPVPPGEVGELYTGGDGLALGYLNRPELTAEKFITNPVPHTPDQLLYRTGDLVRQLPDGNIDYIGRIDDQVKIRGFRIELDEITSVLLDHPNIKQAVVIPYTDKCQAKHIAAYTIFHGPKTSSDELRTHLAAFLPDYMIPSWFLEIKNIPLTTNGKLDKNRLPQPFMSEHDDYIAPVSKLEKQLATVWSRVLNMEPISITDNFFDIGGTSLLGIELIDTINNSITPQKQIESVDLYQYPTIKALASHLAPHKPSSTLDNRQATRAIRQKSAFSKFKKVRRSP